MVTAIYLAMSEGEERSAAVRITDKKKARLANQPGLKSWERMPERPALCAVQHDFVQVRNAQVILQIMQFKYVWGSFDMQITHAAQPPAKG